MLLLFIKFGVSSPQHTLIIKTSSYWVHDLKSFVGQCTIRLVVYRAYGIEAKTIFEGRSRNTRKNTAKVAPRSTRSYHKVDCLPSYFHACYDEITYFNRGVSPIRLP